MKTTLFTGEKVLLRIKEYCAYQERCCAEVREKLYLFAVSKPEAEEIISRLKEENYLNEERFATQFAGGKFRIKQWGKIKIAYALKQKQVDDSLIKKALKNLPKKITSAP